MKAKDKERTGAIRMLLSALQEEETKGTKHELDDAAVLKVITREVKKRRDSAQVYADNGRDDLAAVELAEVEVLSGYQPEQLSDEELKELVNSVVGEIAADADAAPSMKQMGQVMKLAQSRAAGRVDGKRLSTAVKAKLQG